MLLDHKVEVPILSNNKEYYERKGYIIPTYKDARGIIRVKRGTKILIDINDLPIKSNIEVNIRCDYCGKRYKRRYADYNTTKENDKFYNINIDTCNKCKGEKEKLIFTKKYGVTNPNFLEKTKQKISNTCVKKYGVKWVTVNKDTRNKIVKTNIKKYGSITPFGNEKIREKSRNTVKERYGEDIDNVFQADVVKYKIRKSLYVNGKVPCSIQQKYLNVLLKGVLNYPVNNLSLDIAFPDKMIAIEYDGGGHDLQVKLGKSTQEDFIKKEQRRHFMLKDCGWKIIRLISSNDKLPSDETLIKLINEAKQYINTGHSWYEINIDESKVKCSQYEKEIDLGKLRRITKKVLDQQQSKIQNT